MEAITKQNIGIGATSIMAILALVLQFGFVGQDNVYACEDLGIAMQCPEGLSKVNPNGLQTQCKFFSEKLNRSTYKKCKTGWLPYDPKIESKTLNFSRENPVYLLCEKTNEVINECQIIDQNETIYKVEVN